MRRAVLLALARAPEGMTVAELRRELRAQDILVSPAAVAGACRHFYAAGLVWATLTDSPAKRWCMSPALFVAATTLVRDEVEQ